MLKIETKIEGRSRVVRLIGNLRAPELEELATHLDDADSSVTLDLADLKIVDLGAVQLLTECERRGIRIVACPPYVREWMNRERARIKQG